MRLGVLLAGTRTDAEADAQLSAIRQDVHHLTAICPAGTTIQADGTWTTLPGGDRDISRVFTRYYRLWLTPVVECQAPSAIKPEALEAHAKETGSDGFILKFNAWPGDLWVDSLRQAMKNSDLRILVITVNASDAITKIQPVARGIEFTAGSKSPGSAKFMRRTGSADEAILESTDPLLIAY